MHFSNFHLSLKTWFRIAAVLFVGYSLLILTLMIWWSDEPAQFDVVKTAEQKSALLERKIVTGSTVTSTLIQSVRTLLDKPGGYLSNDKFPPGIFLDNIPNWEFGVLTASRDLAAKMRNQFARSQSQSQEDPDLTEADPLLSSPNDRWLFPSSENQYRKAINHLDSYLKRLAEHEQTGTQFYARADNLSDYLSIVTMRMGSLSQRLSASAGQLRLNTDLAGDPTARQSTTAPDLQAIKTPWTKIDDNFYEARGYTWALLQQLKAIEIDFRQTLERKNALVSLRQVIRELEEAQKPIASPLILNGSPFGMFANHSLVLANYVSRANAAIIDLRTLLDRG